MATVFLSYSSIDRADAQRLKAWLEGAGHTVFLDADPQGGLVAGSDWESGLYRQLDACAAVVILLSDNWLASRWCFAEAVHARASGKLLIPVSIGASARAFDDLQEVDWKGGDHNLERLARALRDRFPWQAGRSPYPGLATYTAEDAAVFFGRDQETLHVIEMLEAMRRQSMGHGMLLVLGASGSGKSSLLQAGVLPRLKEFRANWVVLPVVRPRTRPFSELQLALARSSSHITDASGDLIVDAVRRLRLENSQATVLLAVDQGEEMLAAGAGLEATRAWDALRRAVREHAGAFIVVMTIRSDFLGAFQSSAFLLEDDGGWRPGYREYTLDPMPAKRLPEIIERPARTAGYRVEEGLATTLVDGLRDESGRGMRENIETLPLLAFTLRRLWELSRAQGTGELSAGGEALSTTLANAVEAAAQQAMQPVDGSDTVDLAALRTALMELVRVSGDGRILRKRAILEELPEAARPVLRRMVDARLLISDRGEHGGTTLEVVHEAIFRTWPLMARWIEEDRNELLRLEAARVAAADWDRAGRRPDLLVHRDLRLAELDYVSIGPRSSRNSAASGSVLASYLEECRKQREEEAREQAEVQRRELSAARKIAMRTGVGLVASLVLSVALGWMWKEATDSAEESRNQSRMALAGQLLASDPTFAGLVLNEVENPQSISSVRAAVLAVLDHPSTRQLLAHSAPVSAIDMSANGALFVTGSVDGAVRVAGADDPAASAPLPHSRPVTLVRLSPDRRHILAALADGSVQIWETAGRRAAGPTRRHSSPITAADFDPGGRFFVTGTWDGAVVLWPLNAAAEPVVLRASREDASVTSIVFHSSGKGVVAASRDGRLEQWDLQDGHASSVGCTSAAHAAIAAAWQEDLAVGIDESGQLRSVTRGQSTCSDQRAPTPGDVFWASFSTDAKTFIRVDKAGNVTWHSGHRHLAMPQATRRFWRAWLSADGKSVAAADTAGRVWVWLPPGSGLLEVVGHRAQVRSAVFSADNQRLATASDDGQGRLWSLAAAHKITLRHERNVTDLDAATNSGRLVTASSDGRARVWSVEGELLGTLGHAAAVTQARFDPSGTRILTVSGGQVRIWSRAGREWSRRVLPIGGVKSVAFAPDGSSILCVTEQGSVHVIPVDAQTGDAARALEAESPGHLPSAGFSPSGSMIALAGPGHQLRLWKWSGDKPSVSGFAHPPGSSVTSAVFDPSGKRVASAGTDGSVRIWVVSDPAQPPLELSHPGPVRLVAFSPDGEWIASVADDELIRVWPVRKGGAPRVLSGHDLTKRIRSVKFSPDSRLVLSASEDRTARVWSTEGQGDGIVLDAQNARLLIGAVFDHTGTHVVSASADGTATVWTFDPETLLKMARGRTKLCLDAPFRVRHFLESQSEAMRRSRECAAARAAEVREEAGEAHSKSERAGASRATP